MIFSNSAGAVDSLAVSSTRARGRVALSKFRGARDARISSASARGAFISKAWLTVALSEVIKESGQARTVRLAIRDSISSITRKADIFNIAIRALVSTNLTI